MEHPVFASASRAKTLERSGMACKLASWNPQMLSQQCCPPPGHLWSRNSSSKPVSVQLIFSRPARASLLPASRDWQSAYLRASGIRCRCLEATQWAGNIQALSLPARLGSRETGAPGCGFFRGGICRRHGHILSGSRAGARVGSWLQNGEAVGGISGAAPGEASGPAEKGVGWLDGGKRTGQSASPEPDGSESGGAASLPPSLDRLRADAVKGETLTAVSGHGSMGGGKEDVVEVRGLPASEAGGNGPGGGARPGLALDLSPVPAGEAQAAEVLGDWGPTAAEGAKLAGAASKTGSRPGEMPSGSTGSAGSPMGTGRAQGAVWSRGVGGGMGSRGSEQDTWDSSEEASGGMAGPALLDPDGGGGEGWPTGMSAGEQVSSRGMGSLETGAEGDSGAMLRRRSSDGASTSYATAPSAMARGPKQRGPGRGAEGPQSPAPRILFSRRLGLEEQAKATEAARKHRQSSPAVRGWAGRPEQESTEPAVGADTEDEEACLGEGSSSRAGKGPGRWSRGAGRPAEGRGNGPQGLSTRQDLKGSRGMQAHARRSRHLDSSKTQTGQLLGSKKQGSRAGKGEELVKEVVIGVLANGNAAVSQSLQPRLVEIDADSENWNQILKELEKRGARRRALAVFEWMVERAQRGEARLQHHNFNTIILILGREGKLRIARQFFDLMPALQTHQGVTTYCSLMTGYAKHGLVKEAFEVFAQMQAQGKRPSLVAYNILIHACARTGLRINKVVQLYEQLRAAGLDPDGITFNSMIHACIRGGLLDDAARIFQEMKASEFAPNVVTYTSLVDALGKAGRLQEATQVFEEMKAEGHDPNSWTYNALIRAYGRGGQLSQAVGVYRDMEAAGLEPDLFTYNAVLSLYGRGGHVEAAEGILEQMRSRGCTPDRVTYNILLDAYSKGGHFGKAMAVLDAMRAAGCAPDLYTYTILLDACSKSGSLEEAMRMFEDLKAAGHAPNLVAYTAMLHAFGRKGCWQEAEALWGEMRRAGCRPNAITFCALINAYAQTGNCTRAQSVFDEMVRLGVDPDVHTYTALMEAYGRVGDCRRAEELLTAMQHSGFLPDVITYAVLVRAFARANKFEDALEYFELVAQEAHEGGSLSEICRQVLQNHGELFVAFTGRLPRGVDEAQWRKLLGQRRPVGERRGMANREEDREMRWQETGG